MTDITADPGTCPCAFHTHRRNVRKAKESTVTTTTINADEIKPGDNLDITFKGATVKRINTFNEVLVATPDGTVFWLGPSQLKAAEIVRNSKPLPVGLGAIITVKRNSIDVIQLIRVTKDSWRNIATDGLWRNSDIDANGGVIDVLSEGTIL